MISVLCPSRGHPGLLARSISSLTSTASQPPEIVVAADSDDPATGYTAIQYGAHLVVPPQRYGYGALHRYYQAAADEATGAWLMVWNDDAQMLTTGWDTIIEALPPEVLIADIQTNHSPVSCVPAVRRRAVAALGRFSSANPHVDTFWQDVGLATGTMRTIRVYVNLDSPIRKDQTHGFYGEPHKSELAAATAVIRAAFPPVPQSK